MVQELFGGTRGGLIQELLVRCHKCGVVCDWIIIIISGAIRDWFQCIDHHLLNPIRQLGPAAFARALFFSRGSLGLGMFVNSCCEATDGSPYLLPMKSTVRAATLGLPEPPPSTKPRVPLSMPNLFAIIWAAQSVAREIVSTSGGWPDKEPTAIR